MKSLKLSCDVSQPPLGALLTGQYLRTECDLVVEWGKRTFLEISCIGNCNTTLTSSIAISRYFARLFPQKLLYGKTILENTEVDHWLQFGVKNVNNLQLKDCLNYLNQALTSVTYLVGHNITIADLDILGRLYCSGKFREMLNAGSVPQNVLRWYNFLISQDNFKTVSEKLPEESKIMKNKDSAKKDSAAGGDNSLQKTQDKGKFVELPGAEKGKVVVRFPPEASGYLHIGHAKAALLNQHYQVEFEGKLIMRFDDTNPAKEKEDFEKVILEDVALLQIKYDKLSYTSDYFDIIMEKIEKLLKCGMAYVDDTPAEEMKQEREQRIESRNRNNTVEKNLEMWEEMKKGSETGQKQCVRAKLNMNSDNGCMRDPTFYRCKNEIHPRTGNKYKVYPTYDFACPIVDSLEGVTHALRTTEYHDRDDQYFWVLDALDMFKPHIYEYSRLNMMNTVLSKRKLTWFVEQGIVDDWEDPRMPTVRGVLRRGMTVEGLKKFIIAQGSSRSVVLMEWDKIWAFNKKVIDVDAPRYTAVEQKDAVTVSVKDAKEDSMQVLKHPKNPHIGNKTVVTSSKILVDYCDAETMNEGENVTFINWGNLLINKILKNSEGKIENIEASLNLENKDYKKTLKVTWLPVTNSSSLIPCICIYYDHIISKGILSKDEDFKNFLGKNTKIEILMHGESELKDLKKGDIIQLQRKGYFICDRPYDHSTVKHIGRASPLILISIPDGSKDQAYIPKSVQNVRNKDESKEHIQSSKGKIFEKSPQDNIDCSQSFEAQSQKQADLNERSRLDEEIKQQGDKIRNLKAQKIGKNVLDPEIKALLQLKATYKNLTGNEWKPEESKNKASSPKRTDSGEVCKIGKDIEQQGNKIRNLKAEKATKDILDPEIKLLLQLKASYKSLTGADWTPEDSKNKGQCQKGANSDEVSKLNEKIVEQGNKIRNLKAEKASKDVLDPEVKLLLQLKASYKSLTGADWTPEDSKNKGQCQKGANSDEVSKLNEKIIEQGNKIRNLKAEKASKNILDPEIKLLLQLKSDYKSLSGNDWTPEESKNKNANKKKENAKSADNETNKKNSCDDGKGCKRSNNESEKSNKQKNKGKEKSPNEENTQDASAGGVKKVTRLGLEAKKEDNLADWYSQVITKAELIEYYDVSGCYILRPWAFSIWEAIKDFFDSKIKALGVQNCYFPIFVSSHALEKEKTHIADFAPEVAWVTKSGQSDLAEPIAIRPTSETVMYPSYAKWIKSHRDLPLKLNQWCNIVRWEFKHPQPFLRTREILWQEGHTAFSLQSEALEEVNVILGLYADIYEKLLAIPVIRGRKTEKEKFAGGDITFTVEAFISASGRAIQGGTSHHLGQNFSKMFEIMYEDPETNEKKYVFQNSWGLTTRTIGVMIMIHGDNTGLVLPPRVALYQVVIVPCGITASLSEEGKIDLINKCKEFETALTTNGIRVKGDYRDNYSPGWKFNHWELKGVPLRIEFGPKDIKQQQFVVVRRDTGTKEVFKIANAVSCITELLEAVQQNLYNKAEAELKQHLKVSHDWADFCNKLENKCIIEAPFCGEMECEDKIKKDSAKDAEESVEPGAPAMGAKSLCITFQQPGDIDSNMSCIHPECKNKPKFYTLFGRSY